MNLPDNIQQIMEDMSNCQQTEGQSVLQHGLSVLDFYNKILEGPNSKNWGDEIVLPEIIIDNFDLIKSYQHKDASVYIIFHDCGKPYCIEVDENGKKHFPNHAEISYLVFRNIYPCEDGVFNVMSNFIKEDMLLHSGTAEEIASKEWFKFSNDEDKIFGLTLLLVSFAEVLSNAKMFGGIKSQSFCIKYKKLCQRSKQIIKKLNESINEK